MDNYVHTNLIFLTMEYVEIQNERVPKIGLGTWNMHGQDCYRGVLSALEIGYRHIDTAEMYRNEAEVGRAIKESGVSRSEIFLTTKVSPSNATREGVLRAANSSLERLGMEVIDLYLLHWPSRIPLEETMAGLSDLADRGLVRRIGVSNFSVTQLQEAEAASRVRIFSNQIEYFPGFPQTANLRYCQQNDILLTAYSPLDRGRFRVRHTLDPIARRHGVSIAQVALRWLIQQSHVVTIPKSSNADRQRENIDVFGFELSSQEMLDLEASR